MSFPWAVPSGPTISLSAVEGSYPFQTKYISLSNKITFGSLDGGSAKGSVRRASISNGWFSSKDVNGGPLTLSAAHAEVWLENGQVYIRDLDSAFGTYVNGSKITSPVALKSGDIVSLGSKVEKTSQTPANITNDQLLSVTAKVTIVGIP